MMNQATVQKRTYVTIATIAVVMLLGAAVVVPTLSAFADNGNGKSQNDNSHKKSLKGDSVPSLVADPTKEPQRCLHGASAKYNKHCD